MSRYQLAAWRELPDVRCVALYNRTRSKAEVLAREFGIAAVYDQPEELIRCERPDFLDVVTDVATHSRFVRLAAEQRIPVISQKPMASALAGRGSAETTGADNLKTLRLVFAAYESATKGEVWTQNPCWLASASFSDGMRWIK